MRQSLRSGLRRRFAPLSRPGWAEGRRSARADALEPAVRIGNPPFWVSTSRLEEIVQTGLGEIESWLPPKGTCLRRWRDRSNWRLDRPRGGPPWYIKVFTREGGYAAFAAREWRNLRALRLEGFPVPAPIAFGEHRGRSFVASEAVPGRPLDAHLAERVARGAKPDGRLRQLVEEVARLVRTFHGLGYYHRDLYLCHLFVDDGAEGLALHLIDLDRARRRRRPRLRWFIKDLAALELSIPGELSSPRWRLLFLKRYLGGPLWRSEGRKWWRKVSRKRRRLLAHEPRDRAG